MAFNSSSIRQSSSGISVLMQITVFLYSKYSQLALRSRYWWEPLELETDFWTRPPSNVGPKKNSVWSTLGCCWIIFLGQAHSERYYEADLRNHHSGCQYVHHVVLPTKRHHYVALHALILRSLIFPAPNKKRSIRYLLFRLVVFLENFFFFELLCKFFNSF